MKCQSCGNDTHLEEFVPYEEEPLLICESCWSILNPIKVAKMAQAQPDRRKAYTTTERYRSYQRNYKKTKYWERKHVG